MTGENAQHVDEAWERLRLLLVEFCEAPSLSLTDQLVSAYAQFCDVWGCPMSDDRVSMLRAYLTKRCAPNADHVALCREYMQMVASA